MCAGRRSTRTNGRFAAEPAHGLFGDAIERASVITAAGADLLVHDKISGTVWKVSLDD